MEERTNPAGSGAGERRAGFVARNSLTNELSKSEIRFNPSGTVKPKPGETWVWGSVWSRPDYRGVQGM